MRLAANTLRSAMICWMVLLIGAQSLTADEPAARFVNALREKGYYDIALEYLDKAKNNPNVSADFLKRVKFEKATVLIEQVAHLKDRKKVDTQLDTAQRLLKEYASSIQSNGDKNSQVENARTLSYRCLLYTSPSPRDGLLSRMPSSA